MCEKHLGLYPDKGQAIITILTEQTEAKQNPPGGTQTLVTRLGHTCTLSPTKTKRRVWLLHLPNNLLLPLCSWLCQMWDDSCSPAIYHFHRHCFSMPFYKAIMQAQAVQGQSTADIELYSRSFRDRPQTFTASPQPGCPLRPFHTPGCQDLRPALAASRATFVFLPSHLATSQSLNGSCFRKPLRR